jgi:hypothetical protein
VGVRYEARDAPTLQVLFDPLQSHQAFHSEVYKRNTTSNRNTLSPGLTGFRHRSPCLIGQGSPPSVRTTIDRQHLSRHAGSPGGSPSGYLMSRFSTLAINPHPSTLQTSVTESTDVRLVQVVAGTYPHMPTWHASSQISTP